MTIEIEKSILSGQTVCPPSKSIAHRYLICAALSGGESKVCNIDLSDDICATIRCLCAMGAKIDIKDKTAYVKGFDVSNITENAILNCGESGSTLRFFVPIAYLANKKIRFLGSERLMQRPMQIYEELAGKNGFVFNKEGNELEVLGALDGGEYTIKGDVSSQFITGLLFALPLANKDSVIKVLPPFESKSYIYLTYMALKKYGINIDYDNEYTFKIKGGQHYTPCDAVVEGDYSNAAFLDVFNYIGGSVEVKGLDKDSLQGDKVYIEYFKRLAEGTPELDISDCPDLGPVLMALAAIKNGGLLKGTKRLSIKESDRGAVMAQELSKFGVNVCVRENEIEIIKSELKKPSEILKGHNDHRIVMALSVVLTVTGGVIEGAEAINKSFPGYFEEIKKLNARVIRRDS